MAPITHTNGVMTPPQTEKGSTTSSPPRVVLAGTTGRILCVADIRGDYHELNRLIREHEATAVIHTGDFGFMDADSLGRMGDKILRHLLQFSPLLAPGTRQSLLAIPQSAGREALVEALNNSSIHFPLSQFPHLLSGAITFPVPVFTVWGLIEDVRVLEKFRTGEYEVHNLSIIDEACSRVVDVGGLRLRLFGLGGAVAPHKMWEGLASIAGGHGTMWTTALQVGELIDTAHRVYDPSETRLFIASASVSRNGLLSQLSATLKADLTISGGLHFRYPVSFNEFSIHGDFEAYRQKLSQSRETLMGIYHSVKEKVEPSLKWVPLGSELTSDAQQALLKKALAVMQKVPDADDGTWTNAWHWVLSDAACGHLLFSVTRGRVSAETKSAGLNFAHRVANAAEPPSAPKTIATPRPADKPPAPTTTPATPTVRPPFPAVRPGGPIIRPTLQARPFAAANAAARGAMQQRPPLPGKPGSGFVPTAFNPHPAQAPRAPAQAPRAPRAVTSPQTKKADIPAPKEVKDEKVATTAVPAKPAAKDAPTAPATAPTPGPAADASDSGAATPTEESEARPARKLGLFVKGLPDSSTQDDVRAMFSEAKDKILNVRIINDRPPPGRARRGDIAYIDFDNEQDAQTALKGCSKKIKDTDVTVLISNPPARGNGGVRGGRGARRGGSGRGNGSRGEKKEAASAPTADAAK